MMTVFYIIAVLVVVSCLEHLFTVATEFDYEFSESFRSNGYLDDVTHYGIVNGTMNYVVEKIVDKKMEEKYGKDVVEKFNAKYRRH